MEKDELYKLIGRAFEDCKVESHQLFPENTEAEKSKFFWFSLGCGYAFGALLKVISHRNLKGITE